MVSSHPNICEYGRGKVMHLQLSSATKNKTVFFIIKIDTWPPMTSRKGNSFGSFSEIEDEYGSVGGRGSDLVAATVPTNLENTAGSLVRVHLKDVRAN